jgi:hypothetical protein
LSRKYGLSTSQMFAKSRDTAALAMFQRATKYLHSVRRVHAKASPRRLRPTSLTQPSFQCHSSIASTKEFKFTAIVRLVHFDAVVSANLLTFSGNLNLPLSNRLCPFLRLLFRAPYFLCHGISHIPPDSHFCRPRPKPPTSSWLQPSSILICPRFMTPPPLMTPGTFVVPWQWDRRRLTLNCAGTALMHLLRSTLYGYNATYS